jgi:hypothetical protein
MAGTVAGHDGKAPFPVTLKALQRACGEGPP